MARMRVADGGNPIAIAGRTQPITDTRSDQAPAAGIGFRRLSGDDQQHPRIIRHRPREGMFQR